MKRSGPPRRYTPLRTTTPMPTRKVPMGHGDKAMVQKATKKRPARSANPGLEELKAQARERDHNRCVICGAFVTNGRPSNIHHRRNRGMGGSRAANTIQNLITLCGTPTSGCHGAVTLHPWEIDAEHHGWVLPTNGTDDPASRPVLVAWLGWAYPLADGTWQVVEDPRAVAS